MPHPWSALRDCLSPHHGGCCCLMAGILSFEASQGGSRCLESLQVKMHLAQHGQSASCCSISLGTERCCLPAAGWTVASCKWPRQRNIICSLRSDRKASTQAYRDLPVDVSGCAGEGAPVRRILWDRCVELQTTALSRTLK